MFTWFKVPVDACFYCMGNESTREIRELHPFPLRKKVGKSYVFYCGLGHPNKVLGPFGKNLAVLWNFQQQKLWDDFKKTVV